MSAANAMIFSRNARSEGLACKAVRYCLTVSLALVDCAIAEKREPIINPANTANSVRVFMVLAWLG